MGVVRHRAEHREHQGALAVEREVRSDAPAQNKSHHFSTHLDVVIVGEISLCEVEFYAISRRG